MRKYEFAIQKTIKKNKMEILTPVVREKRRLLPPPWNRIVIVYGRAILMELDFEPELTYDQCLEHIEAYKNVLREQVATNIQAVEFHNLEEQSV